MPLKNNNQTTIAVTPKVRDKLQQIITELQLVELQTNNSVIEMLLEVYEQWTSDDINDNSITEDK